MIDFAPAIIAAIMIAATPLVFAALGELVVEKAGVLNLGVEGMMLCGAVAGFAVASGTGSHLAGVCAAALAGAAASMLFGIVGLTLRANHVATGLALTLFGIGLSALIGQGYVGTPLQSMPKVLPQGLQQIPQIGPAVLSHDILVYAGIAMVPVIIWFLNSTRAGLILRAVGENHDSAHALGYPVLKVRYMAVGFGGAMAGIGGGYLSMAVTPLWSENMTAGRGWIALALVVFSSWKPTRCLIGAYLFGGITIVQFHAQGLGVRVDSQILAMLPYLATIAVMVIISSNKARAALAVPGSLNRVFHPPS